jgi:hypothetical protein
MHENIENLSYLFLFFFQISNLFFQLLDTLSAFQLPVQSVPITTNVVSSNPAQARCTRYSIM